MQIRTHPMPAWLSSGPVFSSCNCMQIKKKHYTQPFIVHKLKRLNWASRSWKEEATTQRYKSCQTEACRWSPAFWRNLLWSCHMKGKRVWSIEVAASLGCHREGYYLEILMRHLETSNKTLTLDLQMILKQLWKGTKQTFWCSSTKYLMSHFTAICYQNCINICKVSSANAQYNMQMSEKGGVVKRHTPATHTSVKSSARACGQVRGWNLSIAPTFASHLHLICIISTWTEGYRWRGKTSAFASFICSHWSPLMEWCSLYPAWLKLQHV